MGISEMRRHFAAYGSGELPEGQLRTLIRSAVSHEPQLGQEFIALTDACRRANLISPRLQSNIRADILEVTAPSFDLTMVRPPGAYTGGPTWFENERAANSTDVHIPPGVQGGTYPPARNGDTVRTAAITGQPATTARAPTTAQAPTTARTPTTAQAPTTGPAANTGQNVQTGSTSNGAWNVTDGLSETGAPLYPGAVLRERFVLVEELGHGGMGVVYKAFDRSRGDVKDRYVAIKVLSEEFKRHPLAVKALQREARKAQKLAHPNIVAVHDFDRDGGNVYMVMELLSGRPLDQVLREDGQGGIPPGPALEMIRSLAAALSYAHEHDIVHCDFKPSNAFLGRDGRVKVLDFGIARAAPSMAEKGDVTLFDAGQLGAVSPAYASLELLQGAAPDVRDDVYSFACVAYELLTGVHPYQRIDAVKAFQTWLEPRPIRKLSRSQWRALKQGLAFRRTERCPSIDSLAHQLLAPPPKTRLWIALGAAAVAVAALAGALVWKGAEIQHTAAGWVADSRGQHGAAVPVGHAGGAQAGAGGALADAGGTQADTAAAGAEAAGSSGVVAASAGTTGVGTAGGAATAADTSAASPAGAGTGVGVAGAGAAAVANAGGAGSPGLERPTSSGRAPSLAQSMGAGAGARLPQTLAQAGSTSPAGSATAQPNLPAANLPPVGAERRHAQAEMLQEQFENQAIAADVEGATKTAAALGRAEPGSSYVTSDVPRVLILAYQRRAKTQFAAGQVNEALQTLAEARKHFGRSEELRSQEVNYVAAADLYDRISSAVVLNPIMTRQGLDSLRETQGDDFATTAQMLAHTLANRIADHRAAGRTTVADKLQQTGKELFPDYADILSHGEAGKLSAGPIEVPSQ